MPSLAKHHLLRAYLPLMVPFRTRFSRHEVVHVAYVQRLMGYLYTSWWSTTFLLYASRHTGLSQPTTTVKRESCAGMLERLIQPPLVWMVEGAGGDQRRACLLRGALRTHVGWQVLEVIGGFLCLRCRLHQHGGLITEDLYPAREVGRAVVEGDVGDAAHAAEIRGAHFGDEFLFGVHWITEEAQVGEGLAVEPRRMARGVHKLMVQGGVIRFRAVKAWRARHMQGIRGGLVKGPLMALNDRGPVGHAAH